MLMTLLLLLLLPLLLSLTDVNSLTTATSPSLSPSSVPAGYVYTCHSISSQPGVTDEWCQSLDCNPAYNLFCEYGLVLSDTVVPTAIPTVPDFVQRYQKISDTEGNFAGALDNNDEFGHSVTSVGDLDGDGVVDLAVGVRSDADGGSRTGAVWILFLNIDGSVKSRQKISDLEGGFTGELHGGDRFGRSVTSMGDLDGDGIPPKPPIPHVPPIHPVHPTHPIPPIPPIPSQCRRCGPGRWSSSTQ